MKICITCEGNNLDSKKDNSFSTVISANLLHDVKEPKKVVNEILRVAKPGGKVVISDLNKKGKALVNKVYRINKEIHRGKPINLEKIVAGPFQKSAIKFNKYEDGYVTTYVIIKGNSED